MNDKFFERMKEGLKQIDPTEEEERECIENFEKNIIRAEEGMEAKGFTVHTFRNVNNSFIRNCMKKENSEDYASEYHGFKCITVGYKDKRKLLYLMLKSK